MKWIKLTEDNKPEEGQELLLFNEKWIDEDFNPKGIRIGFYSDAGGWITAYYCNIHDCYHTRISDEDDEQFKLSEGKDQIPTHFMEIDICIIDDTK